MIKWRKRYELYGLDGLRNYSRRPFHSPNKIKDELENYIVACRVQLPAPQHLRIILIFFVLKTQLGMC